MITELTPEQEAYCSVVRDEFINLALNTNTDVNKEACEKYVKLVYSLDDDSTQEKRDALKFVYVKSPFEVQEYLNLYASALTLKKNPDDPFDQETIEHAKKNSRYYSLSYYTSVSNYTWVSFFKYFERIGVLQNELFKNYSDLFIEANLYEWAKLEDRAVICRKPKYIKRDEQGRLNSTNSPAVEWVNGDKHYFAKGIEIPESWIEEKVTLDDIKKANNAELRRIAIELYGYKEYVIDIGAKKIASDEWGDLYRVELEDDEPIVMVSVMNSTCEPYKAMGLEQRQEFRSTELVNREAWFKRYLLRVPPATKTPLEGLAWSHNLSPEEYSKNLLLET
jgi:hypothetical protein